MIYDYRDKAGYVSLWIGNCADYDVLDNYLSTVYLDEDAEPINPLEHIFIPANKHRPFEEELKAAFNDEFYNQFEYDFGISFDEDFRDAQVLDDSTNDLEILFEGFSFYDTFIEEAKTLSAAHLPKCSASLALYDFKYCGGILESKHKNVSMYFLGYVRYHKK